MVKQALAIVALVVLGVIVGVLCRALYLSRKWPEN